MTSSVRPALVAGAALLVLGGCTSLEMTRLGRDLKRDVEEQADVEVGEGYAVGFGRFSLGTARFMGRLTAPGSTEPARRLAGHVRAVKVGRYAVHGRFDGRAVATPPALDRYRRDGWTPLVVARDSASAAWVFLRERPDGRLSDLLAVVLGDGDLVLTKVSGDLSGLVLDAVEIGGAGGAVGRALGRVGLADARDDATSGDPPPGDQEPPAPPADG